MRTGFARAFFSIALLTSLASNVTAGNLPNLYELNGRGVQVTYSSSSLTGEPQLTYSSAKLNKTFRGREITEENTAIGTLVTVTTEMHPDVNFVTFSVLIPEVHLVSGPERFTTEAFSTQHSTPFVLPPGPAGPVETYRPFKMTGRASAVTFLIPNTGITGTISTNTCLPSQPTTGCIMPFSDAAVEIWDTSNNVVAKAAANADGLYSADVAPGNYVVHVVTNGLFPACPDTPATVPSSGSAVVDILCTAIR